MVCKRILLIAVLALVTNAPPSLADSIKFLGIQEGGNSLAVATTGVNVFVGYDRVLVGWNALAPASPVRVANLLLPARIEGLAADPSHVYAALGPAGLYVVDITDPGSPFWF